MRVPYLTGDDRGAGRRDRCCPTATATSAARAGRRCSARMQAAMTQRAGAALGGAQPGIAVATPAGRRSSSPRSSRRRPASRPSGGWSPASIRTGCGSGMPLQADPTVIYPVTRGRPLGRRILPVGASRRQRLQHLCAGRPADRADRQSRARLDRRRAQPGADQCALSSSPTAPAATSSPTRSQQHNANVAALVRDPPRPRRDVRSLAQPALLDAPCRRARASSDGDHDDDRGIGDARSSACRHRAAHQQAPDDPARARRAARGAAAAAPSALQQEQAEAAERAAEDGDREGGGHPGRHRASGHRPPSSRVGERRRPGLR